MKKIAILVCEKVARKCAGGGCFNAFHERKDAFDNYIDDEVCIMGFFHCNGCESNGTSIDWNHKIGGLQRRREVDTIHLALCIEIECHKQDAIRADLEQRGFTVIQGTHALR